MVICRTLFVGWLYLNVYLQDSICRVVLSEWLFVGWHFVGRNYLNGYFQMVFAGCYYLNGYMQYSGIF